MFSASNRALLTALEQGALSRYGQGIHYIDTLGHDTPEVKKNEQTSVKDLADVLDDDLEGVVTIQQKNLALQQKQAKDDKQNHEETTDLLEAQTKELGEVNKGISSLLHKLTGEPFIDTLVQALKRSSRDKEAKISLKDLKEALGQNGQQQQQQGSLVGGLVGSVFDWLGEKGGKILERGKGTFRRRSTKADGHHQNQRTPADVESKSVVSSGPGSLFDTATDLLDIASDNGAGPHDNKRAEKQTKSRTGRALDTLEDVSEAKPRKGFGLKAKAGGLLAAGLAALSVGSILSDDQLSSSEKSQELTKTGGAVAGGLGGAVAGGAAGAAIGGGIGALFGGVGAIPGAFVGELIGNLVGGSFGASAGSDLAEAAYQGVAGTPKSKEEEAAAKAVVPAPAAVNPLKEDLTSSAVPLASVAGVANTVLSSIIPAANAGELPAQAKAVVQPAPPKAPYISGVEPDVADSYAQNNLKVISVGESEGKGKSYELYPMSPEEKQAYFEARDKQKQYQKQLQEKAIADFVKINPAVDPKLVQQLRDGKVQPEEFVKQAEAQQRAADQKKKEAEEAKPGFFGNAWKATTDKVSEFGNSVVDTGKSLVKSTEKKASEAWNALSKWWNTDSEKKPAVSTEAKPAPKPSSEAKTASSEAKPVTATAAPNKPEKAETKQVVPIPPVVPSVDKKSGELVPLPAAPVPAYKDDGRKELAQPKIEREAKAKTDTKLTSKPVGADKFDPVAKPVVPAPPAAAAVVAPEFVGPVKPKEDHSSTKPDSRLPPHRDMTAPICVPAPVIGSGKDDGNPVVQPSPKAPATENAYGVYDEPPLYQLPDGRVVQAPASAAKVEPESKGWSISSSPSAATRADADQSYTVTAPSGQATLSDEAKSGAGIYSGVPYVVDSRNPFSSNRSGVVNSSTLGSAKVTISQGAARAMADPDYDYSDLRHQLGYQDTPTKSLAWAAPDMGQRWEDRSITSGNPEPSKYQFTPQADQLDIARLETALLNLGQDIKALASLGSEKSSDRGEKIRLSPSSGMPLPQPITLDSVPVQINDLGIILINNGAL